MKKATTFLAALLSAVTLMTGFALVPVSAQSDAEIRQQIDELTVQVQRLERQAERLEARAEVLDEIAESSTSPRQARRARARARRVRMRAADRRAAADDIRVRIADLEAQLGGAPTTTTTQPTTTTTQPTTTTTQPTTTTTGPSTVEGIRIADLELSPRARQVIDEATNDLFNAEQTIDDFLFRIANNVQPSNPVLSEPDADLRFMNGGDGRFAYLAPNSQANGLVPRQQSADDVVDDIQSRYLAFLFRGNNSLADARATADELRPITLNSVDSLVQRVNADSPDLPPVNRPTR